MGPLGQAFVWLTTLTRKCFASRHYRLGLLKTAIIRHLLQVASAHIPCSVRGRVLPFPCTRLQTRSVASQRGIAHFALGSRPKGVKGNSSPSVLHLHTSSAMASVTTPGAGKLRYIDAETAKKIDDELMSEQGAFSIDQLMELAGLACAQTVFACYPPEQSPKVLVAAGPGNQGGDGLVAARHLHHFGYEVTVWYPKEGKTELFQRLKKQLINLRINTIEKEEFFDAYEEADVILDSIFGFSFKGEARDPFKEPLDALSTKSRIEFEARKTAPPIVSVDVPSGWNVDEGDAGKKYFMPDVLLSLTAPKAGVRAFTLDPKQPGRHFLGGRFVPGDVEEKFALALPAYLGDSQVVEVTGFGEMSEQEARLLDGN